MSHVFVGTKNLEAPKSVKAVLRNDFFSADVTRLMSMVIKFVNVEGKRELRGRGELKRRGESLKTQRYE